jgi:hypothetical protein
LIYARSVDGEHYLLRAKKRHLASKYQGVTTSQLRWG